MSVAEHPPVSKPVLPRIALGANTVTRKPWDRQDSLFSGWRRESEKFKAKAFQTDWDYTKVRCKV